MSTAQAMYDFLVEWFIPEDDPQGLQVTLDYATALYGMTEQVIEDWCFYHFGANFAQLARD